MKLIVLLAVAGAVAAGVVFSLRNRRSLESTWSSARDSTSDRMKTASDEAGMAADSVTAAASNAADTASHFADQMKEALESKTNPAS
jgi:hypothetical protein